MKSGICALLALSIISLIVHPAGAAIITTASHTFPPDGSSSFNAGAGMATDGAVFDNRQAQTFAATASGTLEDISFIVSKLATTNVDLRVTIAPLVSGQPGTALASRLIDDLSIPSGFLPGHPDTFNAVADFSTSSIPIAASSQYAIVFSTDTTEANYRIYGDHSGYSGGSQMFSQNGSPYSAASGDFFFQVSVNTVPEPGGATLAVIGAGVILVLSILAFHYRRRQAC